MVHRESGLGEAAEQMNTEIDEWVARLARLLDVDFSSLGSVTETNAFANDLFGLPHQEPFTEVSHSHPLSSGPCPVAINSYMRAWQPNSL